MGRMVIPKMDVVRFKENDVIVASGFAYLSGWGNGIDGDAKIKFDNGTNAEYDWNTLHNEAIENMLSNLKFIRGENNTTLNDLGMNENMSSDWNGTYKKQDDNEWHWQHQ